MEGYETTADLRDWKVWEHWSWTKWHEHNIQTACGRDVVSTSHAFKKHSCQLVHITAHSMQGS